MAKKRKRPGSAAAPGENDGGSLWKPLDTGLLAPSKAAPGQIPESADEDFESGLYNHYDNPSSNFYKTAEKELEADPAEAVGIFYGLEVLDGSQYKVVEEGGRKRLVTSAEMEDDNQKADSERGSQDVEEKTENDETVSSKKKKKKKRKKKKKDKDKEKEETDAGESDQKQPKSQEQELSGAIQKDLEATKKQEKLQSSKSSSGIPNEKKTNKKATKTKTKKENKPTKKDGEDESIADDHPDITSLQTSWMTSTGGVTLKDRLCKALLSQQFWTPTPIQAATLPAAILGRRNIVGAAPTGSGKTLAYLLPIFEFFLQRGIDDVERKIHALILTPTRELALQVQRECNKLIQGKCGTLVGGMAAQKQERVLNKNKPPIIIATPGRLWEMLHSRDYEHLNDLSYLRFLVIDEADRMVQQGSFPQLHNILDMVEQANPMESDDEDEGEEDLPEDIEDYDDPDRLLSLPGVKGESKVVMLDDKLLAHIEKQRNGGTLPPPERAELDDDEFEEMHKEKEAELEEDIDEDEISLPARPPVQRQTFVYSATLTLPPSSAFIASQNKKRKRFKLKGVEGAIEEILMKARAKGQTKLVDLSNSKKQAKFNERIMETKDKSKDKSIISKHDPPVVHKRAFNLPPGLQLQEIKCTQMHKDSHLYAYLVTTRQGASGPCLVFCNSIACVRRVGNTLKELGLPVRILHAHMQQRSRFKSVESLQNIESRAVVVATDVAARGLDIPSVATVVHYDVARKVDDFVHRAGRTARGMGDGAVGSSMSLISPAEDKAHKKIVAELGATFEQVRLDGRLLSSAQERANLASKIVSAEEVESKARKKNQWFLEKAEEAGLEVDEENLDEGLAGGNLREQQQLREAQRSKAVLRKLLAEPMVTQRYGKFLSHNSAAKQQEVTPYIVQEESARPKKKRKKKGAAG